MREQPLAVSSDAYYFEKDKSDSVLVMGVGNYLIGDEGVGVHLIEELYKTKLPDHIDLLDGGTGGFLLLNYFETYPNIIIVDATMDGKAEGTISLIKPRFASDFPSALSVHDVGLKDMIESVFLMEKIPELYLFTVSIENMTPMEVGLSPQVRQSIPGLIEQIQLLSEQITSKALI